MSSDLPAEPVTPPQKRHGALWFSWAIILGITALIAFRSLRASDGGGAQDVMNESRARIAGFFAMQLKSVQAGNTSGFSLRTLGGADRLIDDLDREARTGADHVRAIIVRGELHDGADARSAIDRLKPTADEPEIAADLQTLSSIYDDGPSALDAASRERLTKRYGDLGGIALTYGLAEDVEPRKSMQAKAFSFTMRMVVAGLGLMALVGLVFIFFVLGCIELFRGKIVFAYRRGEPSGVFVEGFAWYFVLFLALGLVLRLTDTNRVLSLWLALPIPLIVAKWLLWRGRSWAQIRLAFGWHTGKGVLREAGAGVAGYLAGLVFVAIGAFITVVLVRLSGAGMASPVVEELQGGPLRLLGVFAAACIVAPILEETMFRGVLFHHLRERWGWAASAPTVAFIFAAIHPQGWVAIPVLGSIAIVLAGLREWRGSLIAPVVAHACNNFFALVMALLLLGN